MNICEKLICHSCEENKCDIKEFAKLNGISEDMAKEILEEYYVDQEAQMQEVYEDIIRSSR